MALISDGLIRHLETVVTLPLCFLTVLIVHELGHYLAARFLDLKIESVTFGRGRILWSRTDTRGTLWRLHLWPLRAHVHISDFQTSSISLKQKLFIILAGPAANFALPFLLFFLFFVTFGQPAVPNIITAIEPNMPAYQAGMRPGDKILSVDGRQVRSMDDILAFTQPKPTKPLLIHFTRNGVDFETNVMPVWSKYRDLEGVRREHGRIGLTTWQQPYNLEVVKSVAGVSTPTAAQARAELLRHMNSRIEIGMWSMDGKIYTSVMDLSSRSNRNLNNPGHREYTKIYLGTMRDNFYLPLSQGESLREAVALSTQMIGHVARIPFNLFPIDKEWITPDAVVSRETSYLQVKLYVFAFFASLCSCFIGFLNLMPFPKLDGGEALLLISEWWKRRPLETREKAAVLVLSLLIFYAAVFGANVNDMRSYYLFQIQKASAASEP